jgi:hypothetical protein
MIFTFGCKLGIITKLTTEFILTFYHLKVKMSIYFNNSAFYLSSDYGTKLAQIKQVEELVFSVPQQASLEKNSKEI